MQHQTIGVTRRGKFLVLMCRDEILWPANSHIRFVAFCADRCSARSSSRGTLQQRPRGQHAPIAPDLHPSSRRMCRSHVAAQSYLRSRHSFLNRRPLQNSLNRAPRICSPIHRLTSPNDTSRINPSSLYQKRRPARSSTHKAGVMPRAHGTIAMRRHRNDMTRCPQTVASLRALVRHLVLTKCGNRSAFGASVLAQTDFHCQTRLRGRQKSVCVG